MVLLRHLQGQRIADITCQTHVQSRTAEHVKNQRSSRGLAIRTRDTNHLGVGVTRSELNLREDRRALCYELLHQRCREWNTRRLNHLVSIEDEFGRVLARLPSNVVLVKQSLIHGSNLSHITHKHLHTFGFRQYGSSCARFACT